MITPITPDEMPKIFVPDEVISIFNRHIKKNWNGEQSYILQDDLMHDIVRETGKTRDEVYEHRWLDVEDIYRDAGWSVEYHKPYAMDGENFRSHFIFKKKSRNPNHS